MRRCSDSHGETMDAAIDSGLVGPHHLERNPMSTLARRAGSAPRWSNLPITRASTPYFVLGQDEKGHWIIRESTGKKAGVFRSRQAALRFARLESPDENFVVVHVNDGVRLCGSTSMTCSRSGLSVRTAAGRKAAPSPSS